MQKTMKRPMIYVGMFLVSMALTLHFYSSFHELSNTHEKLGEQYEVVRQENEAFRLMMEENQLLIESMQEEQAELRSQLEQYEQTIEQLTNEQAKLQEELTVAKQEVNTWRPPSRSQTPIAKEVYVEATAYTAYCAGCSGTTAMGIDLRANPDIKVIAVDPSVIPLGSKVYVEGYGYAIAADTGGAIKGHRIDVFIPDKSEVKQWGRKQVKVTVLASS